MVDTPKALSLQSIVTSLLACKEYLLTNRVLLAFGNAKGERRSRRLGTKYTFALGVFEGEGRREKGRWVIL
ncbi:hypothetical protein [Tolypothrix sp. VBCCA 56010]|uniref:hypothetical protein n=1 Tax=Tolypothrix sp. VBCCA 56010 TaxID=3137731 RepID=UPI003D7CAB08